MSGVERMYLYAGSWTEEYDTEGSAGVEVFRQEENTWKRIQTIRTGYSVSRIQADLKNRLLYVCLETRQYSSGKAGGRILWYRINEITGILTFGGMANSCGAYPIDLKVMKDYVLILNHGSTTGKICETYRDADGAVKAEYRYDAASLVLFERAADGGLGEAKDFYLFYGNGSVPFFQESPSPHSLYRLHEDHYLVPERGTDRISSFYINKEEMKIQPGEAYRAPKGVGPRNVAAACGQNNLYVIGEIEPILLCYGKKDGVYQMTGEMVTVPWEELKICGKTRESFAYPHPVDIQISRDERFLYTLTRHSNVLGVLPIQEGVHADFSQESEPCRQETTVQYYRLSGNHPRQMVLKDQELFLVFHDSENIIKLQLDPETGYPVSEKTVIPNIKNIAVMELISLGRSEAEYDFRR